MRFTTDELQLAFTNISSSLFIILLSLSAMSVGRAAAKWVSESLAASICEYVPMSLTIKSTQVAKKVDDPVDADYSG